MRWPRFLVRTSDVAGKGSSEDPLCPADEIGLLLQPRYSCVEACRLGYWNLNNIDPVRRGTIDEAALQVQDDGADARFRCGLLEHEDHSNWCRRNPACADEVGLRGGLQSCRPEHSAS